MEIDRVAVDSALMTATSVSPNDKVQQAFTNMHNDMEHRGENNKRIVITICQCIMDGLRYGNWPE